MYDLHKSFLEPDGKFQVIYGYYSTNVFGNLKQ